MIAPHLKHNLTKQPPPKEPPNPDSENPNQAPPPRPHPKPAYLPTTTPSPLLVDRTLYTRIQSSPRTLTQTHELPPRSGLALPIPRKSILRISTPHGPQVVDLNAFSSPNHAEHFWASRTRQLHSSHLTTHDRLWSNLPYMRPMLTIIADTLTPRLGGPTPFGGRCHDLLGTRCDPYINHLLSSGGGGGGGDSSNIDGSGGGNQDYDHHCHSNLVRAVLPFHIPESSIHDVLNLFQITGLDPQGRYFMEPSPATSADYVELFAEQDLVVALSTCPGGDLSKWGFGAEGEVEMRDCCRGIRVEVFRLEDEEGVLEGWRAPECPAYRGLHGMRVPMGEGGDGGGRSSRSSGGKSGGLAN